MKAENIRYKGAVMCSAKFTGFIDRPTMSWELLFMRLINVLITSCLGVKRKNSKCTFLVISFIGNFVLLLQALPKNPVEVGFPQSGSKCPTGKPTVNATGFSSCQFCFI